MSSNVIVSTKRRTTIGTVLVALFAALTAAGTFISIPLPFTPVPIVLQNLFAILSGLVLGPILGSAAVGLYLIVGAIGAPVFAGATGGWGHFLGPTGGFLFGYLLGALMAGLITGTSGKNRDIPLWRLILGTILGFLAVYIPGLIRLRMFVDSWPAVLAAGFIPFIIGDGIKAGAAVLIAFRLRRIVADLFER